MRNRKKTVVVLLLASLLGFAGCNYLAGRGAMYDIIYSSEYSRDPYTREEMTPVQGNDEDWQLRLLPAADDDPAALQLLDAAGQPLCTVLAAGLEANRNTTLALRAEAGLGQTVWLTAVCKAAGFGWSALRMAACFYRRKLSLESCFSQPAARAAISIILVKRLAGGMIFARLRFIGEILTAGCCRIQFAPLIMLVRRC